VLAAAVVVAKIADFQFDGFFYVAASLAAVLLLITREKIAYVAAAFGWMAIRLIIASAFRSDVRMFGWGVVFGVAAVAAVVVAARREIRDDRRKYW